eukprot:jgi/Chlat1/2810/Chrsp187S02962
MLLAVGRVTAGRLWAVRSRSVAGGGGGGRSLWDRLAGIGGRSALSSEAAAAESEQAERTSGGDIHITESCVRRLKELQQAGGGTNEMLRVSIEGGGCSGYQYAFTLDTNVESDDRVVEHNGIKLLVDMVSYPFIKGATIDYEEDLIRASFAVVNNPNSASSCGCGSSFAAK